MKSININEFVRGQLSEKGKYIFIHQYDYIFPDLIEKYNQLIELNDKNINS